MAYAFVQQVQASNAGTGQASIASGSFGSNLTAGNLLWWVVQYTSTASKTISFSDTRGFTFVECGNFFDATNTVGLRWGYVKNISAGAENITVTFQTNVDFPGIYVEEYSGLDTTAPFTTGEVANSRQSAPGTGTDALTTGNTPALAAQPAMLVGLNFDWTTNNVANAGTGFTSRTSVWDYGGITTFQARPQDKRLTATTAVAATWTATNGTDIYFSCCAVFKEAGAGGSTPVLEPWQQQGAMGVMLAH